MALDLLAQLALPIPPPPNAAAWQTVKTVDGVTLKRAPSDRAAPWGMGEGDIAAPLDRVVAHLTDFAALGKWMPRVADLRVVERGADEALVYFRFDLPWPISDRDWTLRYRWHRDGDRFVMIWSDAHDRGPPPSTRGAAVAAARLLGAARDAGRHHLRPLRVPVRARRLLAAQHRRRDRLETAAGQHPRCTFCYDKSVNRRTI